MFLCAIFITFCPTSPCLLARSILFEAEGEKGKGGGGRTKIFLSKKGMGMLASRGIRNPGEGGGGYVYLLSPRFHFQFPDFHLNFSHAPKFLEGGGQLCDNLIFSMLI